MITGATSDIELNWPKLFAKDKYHPMIVARDEQALSETSTQLTELDTLEVVTKWFPFPYLVLRSATFTSNVPALLDDIQPLRKHLCWVFAPTAETLSRFSFRYVRKLKLLHDKIKAGDVSATS